MRNRMTMLFGLMIVSTLNIAWAQTNADKQQPQPALKVKEKPSEVDTRTTTKPGKPESDQPPPDIVGQPNLIHPATTMTSTKPTRKSAKLKHKRIVAPGNIPKHDS